MKRCFLAASLLLCMLLSACAAFDPENLFDLPSGQIDRSASLQETEHSTPEPDPIQTEDADFYPCGNMQKSVPSGDYVQRGNELLFFRTDRNTGITLYTYDLTTKEISTFCKDATCTHMADVCAAGGAGSNLELYGEDVYALSANGAVLKLTGDRFEQIVEGGVSHFFHSGGKLYVQTLDNSLMVYEREGGKPQMLLEEYTGYWETLLDGKLYYQFSGVHCVDLNSEPPEEKTFVEHADHITDGQFLYYAPYPEFQLYRMDLDGKNRTLLLEEPVLPASWNFDEEYLYFRLYTGGELDSEDGRDLYRLKKDEPNLIEKIAELPAAAYQIFTSPNSEYLFVSTYTAAEDDVVYLVSKDGSEEPTPLGGPDLLAE